MTSIETSIKSRHVLIETRARVRINVLICVNLCNNLYIICMIARVIHTMVITILISRSVPLISPNVTCNYSFSVVLVLSLPLGAVEV